MTLKDGVYRTWELTGRRLLLGLRMGGLCANRLREPPTAGRPMRLPLVSQPSVGERVVACGGPVPIATG